MLTVITRPRVRRKFLTYDLEWAPGTDEDGRLRLRLIGVYDGERYRAYYTMEEFLRCELTKRNRGAWFYAHAGGMADFQFVLEQLIHEKQQGKRWEVQACFSGSSANIVKVKYQKHVWTFVDSYWLLRDKLDNIATWIGETKGAEQERKEDAKSYFANAPIHELLAYNEQDCVILYKAIDAMQETLIELGGQLQRTLASSAMYLFRRRFLSNNITTDRWVNNISDESYHASRVEVFSVHAWDAEYYDINSSFPASMLEPCPGQYLGMSPRLPTDGKTLYIALATVHVPDCYLPPLPARMEGRLFFPMGTWRGWFTGYDLELLEKHGGKILRVWQCLTFEPFTDLAEYARTIYNLRKNAGSAFEKSAYKLLLNSLYGKFAEGLSKTSMVVDPQTIPENPPSEGWSMLTPGIWLIEHESKVPHRHVPISSYITSRSRGSIFEFMDEREIVHYCDTDGFSTNAGNPIEPTDALGGLKLEKRVHHGEFLAPKSYLQKGETQDKEGNWKPYTDVKMKGVTLDHKTQVEQFMLLKEGHAIQQERMVRIRENLRRGNTAPRDKTFLKKMRDNVVSKRFHYPDGHTRPWHMKELHEHFKKKK